MSLVRHRAGGARDLTGPRGKTSARRLSGCSGDFSRKMWLDRVLWLGLCALGVAALAAAAPALDRRPEMGPWPAEAAEEPRLVRVGMLGGRVRAVAMAPAPPGGLEYALIGHEDSLLVVPADAEGRLAPTLALELPGTVRDITVHGAHAFAALDTSGLAILDVADPAAPRLLARLDLPGIATAVAVPDDSVGPAEWVAVAAGAGGLHLVDVRDPERPVLGGTLSTRRDAVDVAARGRMVYVAEETLLEGMLRVVDVSSLDSPVERASIDFGPGARTVALMPPAVEVDPDAHERIALVGGSGGAMWSIGLDDPTAPERLGVLWPIVGLAVPLSDHAARAIAISPGADAAFVTLGDAGVRVVDIADPGRLTETARRGLSGPAGALSFGRGGWRAFVALDTGGLAVLDSRARNRLPELGRWDLVGQALGVVIDGDFAWLADGFGWARGVDVSDPAAPIVAGLHQVPRGRPRSITGLGGYLFIGTERSPKLIEGGGPDAFEDLGGIDVAWVGNPAAPIAAISFEPRRTFPAVASAGTWLFAAEDSPELPVHLDPPLALRAFDVSNPLRPGARSALAVPESPTGIAIAGGVAYLSVRAIGIATIDVSNPREPVGIGGARTPGEALDVQAGDGHVYVADGEWGVSVLDASDPSAPRLVGRLNTPGRAEAVAYDGRWLWVADGPGGVRLIDVTDPAAPVEVASERVPGNAVDIVTRGPYAYVADEDGWIVILRLDGVDSGPEVTPSPTFLLPSPIPTETETPAPTREATATPTADPPDERAIYLPRVRR